MKLKYLLYLIILSLIISTPAQAMQERLLATVQEEISTEEMPKGVSFTIPNTLMVSNGRVIIPKGSKVYAYIVASQGERRWHKSGFIICQIKGYEAPTPDGSEKREFVDVEKREIYLIARKYQEINKKEVAKTAVELAATTTAGVFVPGADIAYYFAKGMIKKQENKTRFKSGLSSAYENSIFWFWLKGKPVDLEENAIIKFSEITKDEKEKLAKQIDKRVERGERMEARKEGFKEFMSF